MNYLQIIKNMGIRYSLFRIFYEVQRRSGIIKKRFPISIEYSPSFNLSFWRINKINFFVNQTPDFGTFSLSDSEREHLQVEYNDLKQGKLRIFSGNKQNDVFNNWHQNPENGFLFDKNLHWTTINEFAEGHGDIKYIWEKGRFCYLSTVIRYDAHNKTDSGEFALSLIESWIDNTILNCGPYYKCSQELAIRLCNWIFALYFYQNSNALTEKRFNKIIKSIYEQTIHIEKNISFASIAVRNNHLISEATGLFTIGILFPWFPCSKKWKTLGMAILEREGLYQIYPDGSYLQHSFNYQRVVLQLYTWVVRIAQVNNLVFSDRVLESLRNSIRFMSAFQQKENGALPNYGANDGALIFNLNSCSFSDYRPQINALNLSITGESLYSKGSWNEDQYWFGMHFNAKPPLDEYPENKMESFKDGGYYVLKSNDKMTFIRCASFRHRPSHSDNLHVDIWHKGENILCDRGSYSYNTSEEILKSFVCAAAHNTIILNPYDQMIKGPRFIWYYWSKALSAQTEETSDYLEFRGAIEAFAYLKQGIIHKRTIRQYKNVIKWEVVDKIENWNGEISQNWNCSYSFFKNGYAIQSCNGDGDILCPTKQPALYSETYGAKQEITSLVFKTNNNMIKTSIVKI